MRALPIPLRTGRIDLRHYQMGGGLVEGREFMNVYGADHDDAPSEIVAVTYGDDCQERAAEIVAAVNEYDALKAVEAAARAFDTHELFFTTLEGTTYCMVCNGTDGDHVSIIFGNDRRPCPVPGFLDALAALDAIRKPEVAR